MSGSAAENTRAMTPVTRQTGHVQTPSLCPDGSELVYLSDNGGHANLWVIRTDGPRARRITFERDPAVTVGVPKWSPAGDVILYIVNRELPQLWLIRPDGRGAQKLVERGVCATWSPDGRSIYDSPNVDGEQACIEKVSVAGGAVTIVRGDRNSNMPTVGEDVLYFAAFEAPEFRSMDWELDGHLQRADRRSSSVGSTGVECRSPRCMFIQYCRKTANGSHRHLPMARRATLDAVNQGRLLAAGDGLRRSGDR